MKLSDIVIKKGYKTGMVYLQDITLGDIRSVFFPLDTHEKYRYLGITYNIFRVNTRNAELLDDFYKFVDSKVKPWYVPRWFLRLLHLFGNDNSIVRVRSQWIHKLHRKLTGGVIIQQVKTKFGTLRIYGYFTEEIQNRITELEKEINPTLTPY